MTNGKFTRRAFVRGAGVALAAPYAITSSALGNAARPAASERITMGAIGLGGRGRSDLGSPEKDLFMSPAVSVMGRHVDLDSGSSAANRMGP